MSINKYKYLSKNYNFILSIFFVLFIILTNNYISVKDGVIEGWSDQLWYLEIASKSPIFPNIEIPDHHAQRFVFPYLFGLVVNILNLEENIHLSFIIFNVVTIFFTLFVLLKINTSIVEDRFLAILLAGIFFFNPYFCRVALYAPFQINDYIFTLFFLLIIHSILNKNFFLFLLFFFVCSLARQTSIFLLPLLFLVSISNFLKKEKNFINLKLFVCSLVLFITAYLFTKILSSPFSSDLKEYKVLFLGFTYKSTLEDWFYFISRFILGNVIILIFTFSILIFFFRSIKNILNKRYVLLIFSMTLITWFQPFLAGVEFTGGNIIRLTVMTNVGIIISLAIFLSNFQISRSLFYILIFLLALISFCHKSAIFNNYFSANFQNYGIYIILISIIFFLIILFFLKKNKTIITL